MEKESSKTSRIKQYIHSLIDRNEMTAGDRLPTEKTLSELFKVSRMPVQTALNQLEEEGLIRRVKGSGSFLLSDQKRAGPAQTGGSGSIIPFVIPEPMSGARFWETVKGAENYLQKNNCYLTVHYPEDGTGPERQMMQKLIDEGFHSILVALAEKTSGNEAFFNSLIRNGVNIVFVDSIPKGVTGNQVASDNQLGGYLAARHLFDQGYERIGILYGHHPPNSSAAQRIDGCLLALSEYGKPFHDAYYYCPDLIMKETGIASFELALDHLAGRLKRMPEPPDALICTNDVMSITVSLALGRAGLRIPDDIAIIGYDNLPEIAAMPVPLSSIEQPFFALGYEAAKLCLENQKNPSEISRHLYLPVSLIARESTKKKTRNL